MTFRALEKRLQDLKLDTEKDLLQTLELPSPDSFLLEEARQMEQELWLIERLRCRIFYPVNRPRQDGVVTRAFMSIIMKELSEEFMAQARFGLCFFLKIRQSALIEMCTEDEVQLKKAS
jgi:hypothetical protein